MIRVLGFMFLVVPAIVMSENKFALAQELTNAQMVWEKAVAAKGGRERLYEVSSILERWESSSLTTKGRAYQRNGTGLIVLPSKVWSYIDDRPDVFGRYAIMFDYGNMTNYYWAEGRKNVVSSSMPTGFLRQMKAYQNTGITYLLETKWLRPTLIDMKTTTVEGDKVFIVQTNIDGRRVDFFINEKTYLPSKVATYDVSSDGKVTMHQRVLVDYVDVDGIKVPSRTKYDDGSWETCQLRFNVDYDPTIFVRAPDNLGPDSWRPKR